MIPDFNENGNLPPGIHASTMEEFKERFVYGVKRRLLFGGLIKLIIDLKEINCCRIYIDGSYVTTTVQPKDIDICWDDRFLNGNYEVAERKFPVLFDLEFPRNEQKKKYLSDVFPAYFTTKLDGIYFIEYFQRDKNTLGSKGVIQLNI